MKLFNAIIYNSLEVEIVYIYNRYKKKPNSNLTIRILIFLEVVTMKKLIFC